MRATINRKTYNTETATDIGDDSAECPTSDFRHWSETLYVTKKGAYFLHGEGGPMSKYSRTLGNESRGDDQIIPLTKEEAIEWCEQHHCQETLEGHFGDDIEDA